MGEEETMKEVGITNGIRTTCAIKIEISLGDLTSIDKLR